MLIRVADAFRTASTAALQVVAIVVPIDLLALEKRFTFENGALAARQKAREMPMEKQ